MAAPARNVSHSHFVAPATASPTNSSRPITLDSLGTFEERPFSHLYGRGAIAADDPNICEKHQTLIAFMHNLQGAHAHCSIRKFLKETSDCCDLERAVQIRLWLDEHGRKIKKLPWLDLDSADPRKIPILPPETIRLKSLNPIHKALVLASFLYHNNETYARQAFQSDFIQPEHKFGALLLAAWYSNNVPLFHKLRELPHDKVIHRSFCENLASIFTPEKPSERIPLYQELSTIPELWNIGDFRNTFEGFLRLNDAANNRNMNAVDAYLSQGVIQPFYLAIQLLLNKQAICLDEAYYQSLAVHEATVVAEQIDDQGNPVLDEAGQPITATMFNVDVHKRFLLKAEEAKKKAEQRLRTI